MVCAVQQLPRFQLGTVMPIEQEKGPQSCYIKGAVAQRLMFYIGTCPKSKKVYVHEGSFRLRHTEKEHNSGKGSNHFRCLAL